MLTGSGRKGRLTRQLLLIQQVEHDDGHSRPGDDESQDQDPGQGRAEGAVQVISHGLLRGPGGQLHHVAILAVDDSGGGGRSPSTLKKRQEGQPDIKLRI